MTKTAAQINTPKPCLCSQFEIVLREWTADSGQPEIETEGTGCTATTMREFAPGSDAKLKSLLIRAGVLGLEVRRHLGGVVHSGDAITMAREFGFAQMVVAGIERGLAKSEARKTKAATRSAAPKTVKIKGADRAAALVERMATKAPAPKMPREVAAQVATAIATGNQTQSDRQLLAGTVQIKVGRWEYPATIDTKGDARFTDKQGNAKTAVKGVYKLA